MMVMVVVEVGVVVVLVVMVVCSAKKSKLDASKKHQLMSEDEMRIGER